jgi:hypothetical protein
MSDDPVLDLLRESRDAALAAERAAKPLAHLPAVIVNFADRLAALENVTSASDFSVAMIEANKVLETVKTLVGFTQVRVRAVVAATLVGFVLFALGGAAASWLVFRPASSGTLKACQQIKGQISAQGTRRYCWFDILSDQ